jgi:hypothetical protein
VVEPPPPPPPPPPDPGLPPEASPPPPPEPGLCPRCGAPHDPYQEYCLECGLRLPPPYAVQREIWSRQSPLWLWAALAALLLVALVAGAIVAIAATRDDKESGPRTSIPIVSTSPQATDTVGIVTQPPTVTINPPTTTFTTTTLPTTTVGTTTFGTTTTTTGNVTWPAGKDGYSIFLKSVPTSEGRSAADAEAARARRRGLTQVGVLNSSDYSSLRPGYWVTFTGIYDTQRQALNALPNARSKGYPLAYVREVRD